MSKLPINDPALHRKLSEPVESIKEAERLGDEFYDEVCKLREKYHIPEMIIAFGINAQKEDGDETFVIQAGYRGGLRVERLVLELVKQTRFGKTLLEFIDELSAAALR